MIQEFADFSHKMTACFGDFSEFEQKIRQIAEIAQIELREFEIDHLAVRMNSVEKALEWKTALLSPLPPAMQGTSPASGGRKYFGELLKESEVNGRPIALISLNQSLIFCEQAVSVIELPFPKNKIYPEEGWEHIEIVVPMENNETVEQWVERCNKRWHLQKNLQIKLKISEPKVEGERLPNPSIAISLADKSLLNFCTIKLHPYSIREICQKN